MGPEIGLGCDLQPCSHADSPVWTDGTFRLEDRMRVSQATCILHYTKPRALKVLKAFISHSPDDVPIQQGLGV